jgi:hypothetical protein
MYDITQPVEREVWRNHEIVGKVILSRADADMLNSIKGVGVYFGFTPEEHDLLQNGTEEQLIETGFIRE